MGRIHLIPAEETVESFTNTAIPGSRQDVPGPVEKQLGGPAEEMELCAGC